MTWIKRAGRPGPVAVTVNPGVALTKVKRAGAPAAIVTALHPGERLCAKRSFCSRSAA